MQHPNIERVHAIYAAYMSGDRARVADAFAPDVRWHNSGYDENAGTLVGVEAVLGYLMGENHLDDYGLEVVDMLASDERVAVIARASGRRGTQRIVNDYVQVVRIVEDRVSEVWNYNWDQRALAEAMPVTA
jgi:uncharacterized protein